MENARLRTACWAGRREIVKEIKRGGRFITAGHAFPSMQAARDYATRIDAKWRKRRAERRARAITRKAA